MKLCWNLQNIQVGLAAIKQLTAMTYIKALEITFTRQPFFWSLRQTVNQAVNIYTHAVFPHRPTGHSQTFQFIVLYYINAMVRLWRRRVIVAVRYRVFTPLVMAHLHFVKKIDCFYEGYNTCSMPWGQIHRTLHNLKFAYMFLLLLLLLLFLNKNTADVCNILRGVSHWHGIHIGLYACLLRCKIWYHDRWVFIRNEGTQIQKWVYFEQLL